MTALLIKALLSLHGWQLGSCAVRILCWHTYKVVLSFGFVGSALDRWIVATHSLQGQSPKLGSCKCPIALQGWLMIMSTWLSMPHDGCLSFFT